VVTDFSRFESFVREAMELAEEAADAGNRPFGAVLVDPSGVVVARNRNRVVESGDPLAHAEINLLRDHCVRSESAFLRGFALFTNAEPCPMCFSAAVKVGIATIGYGAPREPGTLPAIGAQQLAALSGEMQVHSGILHFEALEQLKRLLGDAKDH
jgi:tRNA(Arg) A34 adenosine deaminase TadA